MRLIFLAAALFALAAPARAKPDLKPLIEKLDTAKGPELIAVVEALGRAGRKEAVVPLLGIYDARKNSPRLTSALVVSLGELKDPRAVDPLVGTWDYLNSLRLQMQADFPAHLQILRAAIVRSLGMIGGDRGLPVLRDAIQDKDQLVVGRAAEALGALRDKEAVEALIQLIGRGGNVRQSAIESLAEIEDPLAITPLEGLLHNDDPSVRAQAAYALVKLKDKDEDGALVLSNMVTSERLELKDRLFAAYYLFRLGDRAGFEFLTARLTQGADDGRLLAAQALGRAKNEKAVPALAEAAAKAKDESLRLVIAQSLGEIGGTRAVGALKRLADDRDQSVRAAAKRELADLGEEL